MRIKYSNVKQFINIAVLEKIEKETTLLKRLDPNQNSKKRRLGRKTN